MSDRGDRVKFILIFILALVFAGPRLGRAEIFKVAMPSTTQAVLPFTIARDKG